MEELSKNKNSLLKIIKVAVLILVFCFLFRFMFDFIPLEIGDKTKNTISFTGHGEVSAVPDIANISFTIREEAKTVKAAQEKVAEIEKKVLEFLRTNKVEDKDIKTISASFNPKYEYQYLNDVVCGALTCPPRPNKQVITGYEAYENLTVKIRNTDEAGKIIQGIGALEVTDLNGPNFAVDQEEAFKVEARKEAINEAKAKAKVLAKDLGIRLGKITSFSEGDNYPRPMYESAMLKGAGAVADSTTPAELPKGENLITSDVTITYEIR